MRGEGIGADMRDGGGEGDGVQIFATVESIFFDACYVVWEGDHSQT